MANAYLTNCSIVPLSYLSVHLVDINLKRCKIWVVIFSSLGVPKTLLLVVLLLLSREACKRLERRANGHAMLA